jgi:hypothetical protein
MKIFLQLFGNYFLLLVHSKKHSEKIVSRRFFTPLAEPFSNFQVEPTDIEIRMLRQKKVLPVAVFIPNRNTVNTVRIL